MRVWVCDRIELCVYAMMGCIPGHTRWLREQTYVLLLVCRDAGLLGRLVQARAFSEIGGGLRLEPTIRERLTMVRKMEACVRVIGDAEKHLLLRIMGGEDSAPFRLSLLTGRSSHTPYYLPQIVDLLFVVSGKTCCCLQNVECRRMPVSRASARRLLRSLISSGNRSSSYIWGKTVNYAQTLTECGWAVGSAIPMVALPPEST